MNYDPIINSKLNIELYCWRKEVTGIPFQTRINSL